jgi:Spy/CpxP family protein refolding chaperone
MARIILRMVFILSISFNIAFVIHLLGHTSDRENIQLNMTDRQTEAVTKIHMKLHKENEGIKKEIRECQIELINALKADKVNREIVGKCIEKISILQKKIQQNTIDEIIQVKQYLNDHQCGCLIDGLNLRLSQVSKPCDKECCRPKK